MRKHMWRIAYFGFATLVLSACSPAENPIFYPETERGNVVDTYFGDEVADPYRWLEDLDGEATAAWVEAQNAISFPFLEAIPQRDAIKNRLTELWNYERFGTPKKEGSRYFYTRNDGLQDQDVLYVTDALDAECVDRRFRRIAPSPGGGGDRRVRRGGHRVRGTAGTPASAGP